MRKLNLEIVKEFANQYGFEVLDTEYIDMKTKMKFQCIKCGCIAEKNFNTFKAHHNCQQCTPKITHTKYTEEYIEELLKPYSFMLISIENYRSSDSVIKVKCKKCGYEFTKTLCNLLKSPLCVKCDGNSRRLSFNQAKHFVEVESQSNCLFLETEYSYKLKRSIDNRMACCKFKFQCECGNTFETTFNQFKNNKRRCNACNGVVYKHSYDDVKQYIEKTSHSGCKLLSTEYIDTHTPLLLQCSCGNIFKRALAEFKHNKLYKCKKCTGATIPHTTEEIKEDLNKHNIKLLSEYINYNTEIYVEYECGFKVSRLYRNIIRSKYKCPHCKRIGYQRDTEQLSKEISELTNGEYVLLSEYKTMNDKVWVYHKTCKHKYEVTPHGFVDGQRRCPFCGGNSHVEILINKYLMDNNINFLPQYMFDGLVGLGGYPLKFDFAIFEDEGKSKLKYLIEYDGEFHFKKYYEEQNFETQQIHDKRKNDYCRENNITLIRIPYWEKENLIHILDDIINKNKIRKDLIVWHKN